MENKKKSCDRKDVTSQKNPQRVAGTAALTELFTPVTLSQHSCEAQEANETQKSLMVSSRSRRKWI